MNAKGEWRTLGLLGTCYATWLVVTACAHALGPWLALPLVALTISGRASQGPRGSAQAVTTSQVA